MSLGPRMQWLAVRPGLRAIVAMLQYLGPYQVRQRAYEQVARAFSRELSFTLDILDQERHR